VKRYEGLIILKHTVKEESIKDVIDKITSEITNAGGKVETVQKMDKRNFSRVADKKYTAGFYVNFIFEAPSTTVSQLRTRLTLNEDIFRSMFTVAPPPVENPAAAAAAPVNK
jgi:ribosomal protein S6